MPSAPDGTPASVTVTVSDEAALAPLARRLASSLPPRAFVALEGDLGAGKTTFVKAVAAALGIDPTEVVSPTFGLIHVHDLPPAAGRGRPTPDTGVDEPGIDEPGLPSRLVHADFYRLSAARDLVEIGWDDATQGRCWVFVEWPSRATEALPADRVEIAISIDSETGRTFRFTAPDGWHLPGS